MAQPPKEAVKSARPLRPTIVVTSANSPDTGLAVKALLPLLPRRYTGGQFEEALMNDTRFLTFTQLSARVALGRTRIYAGIAAKTFPAPVKLGRRSVWVEAEVEQWMCERIAERDGH